MLILVGRIKINQVAILVGLVVLDQVLVLLQSEIFALDILHQGELNRTVVELLVGQHTILDEEFQAVPFLLELSPVGLEDLLQTVGHLLRDVARDLLHVLVALQIRTRDVQRDIRRVEHTMQQGQELRNDSLNRVGHEDLIAIELDLIAVQIQVALDAREVKDTGQVERIIHVQVDPEQRLLAHRVKILIEFLVILILQFRRLADPCRLRVVDDVILIGIDILAILPFLLLAKGDLDRQETAVLRQQAIDLLLVQEILVLIVDIQNDIRTTVGLVGLLHRIFRRTIATPLHRYGTLLI